MFKKHNYVYRALSAQTIETLYYEPNTTGRKYEQIHSLYTRFIVGVKNESARKLVKEAEQLTDVELPDYIYAMYQTVEPLHDVAKLGFSMPPKGRLKVEDLARYFAQIVETKQALRKAAERSSSRGASPSPEQPAEKVPELQL